MLIAAKNSYFSQPPRTETVQDFQTVPAKSREAGISGAMDWLDGTKDFFSDDAAPMALGHLFDMAHAETANQSELLTFAEKRSNCDKAKKHLMSYRSWLTQNSISFRPSIARTKFRIRF